MKGVDSKWNITGTLHFEIEAVYIIPAIVINPHKSQEQTSEHDGIYLEESALSSRTIASAFHVTCKK
jgi:hypothetical protein